MHVKITSTLLFPQVYAISRTNKHTSIIFVARIPCLDAQLPYNKMLYTSPEIFSLATFNPVHVKYT